MLGSLAQCVTSGSFRTAGARRRDLCTGSQTAASWYAACEHFFNSFVRGDLGSPLLPLLG